MSHPPRYRDSRHKPSSREKKVRFPMQDEYIPAVPTPARASYGDVNRHGSAGVPRGSTKRDDPPRHHPPNMTDYRRPPSNYVNDGSPYPYAGSKSLPPRKREVYPTEDKRVRPRSNHMANPTPPDHHHRYEQQQHPAQQSRPYQYHGRAPSPPSDRRRQGHRQSHHADDHHRGEHRTHDTSLRERRPDAHGRPNWGQVAAGAAVTGGQAWARDAKRGNAGNVRAPTTAAAMSAAKDLLRGGKHAGQSGRGGGGRRDGHGPENTLAGFVAGRFAGGRPRR